jgi:hypothetical protein
MALHNLQVAVCPVPGAPSVTYSRTDGSGRAQVKLVVLDEMFVEAVRVAYLKLDLTQITDIVNAIWGDLLGLPVLQDGTKREIETALIHLSEADEILLPTSTEELSE